MPKYNVTGWIPTALYATVIVEAPNAQEALKIGEPMLSEVGEYEYVDDNATCSAHDELRAESEEATDTANWSAADDLKVAAGALLAALRDVVKITESGDDIGNGDLLAIGAAIVAAEAAGITTAAATCPARDGLGAFPKTGETCEPCAGGGEVIKAEG